MAIPKDLRVYKTRMIQEAINDKMNMDGHETKEQKERCSYIR